MRSNVLVVGLLDNYNKQIAHEISNQLGIYFLDIDDMIEYEIADRQQMIDLCGIEYLENQEFKLVRSVANYQDTVINVSSDLFMRERYYDIFENNCHIIYIAFDEAQLKEYEKGRKERSYRINKIAYSDRVSYLQAHCDYQLEGDKNNPYEIVKNIIKYLKRNNYETKSNCD